MNNDFSNMTEAQNNALDQRQSMSVKLNDFLFESLQKETGHDRLTKDNYTAMTTATAAAAAAALQEAIITNQPTTTLRKLKSSLKISTSRQVASEPSSPKHYHQQKSVKFDPVYLERICFFEGSHSPNEIQRLDEKNNCPLFKIKYSSHWPAHLPTSKLLYQSQKNVHLMKKSLKVLEGGTCLGGQVAVKNIGFEKNVEIRYTLDGWQTVDNVQAQFQFSKGNQLDIFSFDLNIEPGMDDRGLIRCTVDMAVRYTVKSAHHDSQQQEDEFWDNNNGYNYQIQIVEVNDHQQHLHHQLAENTIPSPLSQKVQSDNHDQDILDNKDNKQQEQKESDKKKDIKDEEDEDDTIIQKPVIKTMKSPSLNRYDFSQSLQKAKKQSKTSSSSTSLPNMSITTAVTDVSPIPIQRFHRLSLKPTFEEHIPLSISNYSINNSTERRKAYSAPSSPQNSSLLDFFTSSQQQQQNNDTSLPPISYTELVNKYCFYGSQNSQSSALSIH
ncbi:unnamed protein product [Cunninghamella echinulata]